jgi:hypothetical protein
VVKTTWAPRGACSPVSAATYGLLRVQNHCNLVAAHSLLLQEPANAGDGQRRLAAAERAVQIEFVFGLRKG